MKLYIHLNISVDLKLGIEPPIFSNLLNTSSAIKCIESLNCLTEAQLFLMQRSEGLPDGSSKEHTKAYETQDPLDSVSCVELCLLLPFI